LLGIRVRCNESSNQEEFVVVRLLCDRRLFSDGRDSSGHSRRRNALWPRRDLDFDRGTRTNLGVGARSLADRAIRGSAKAPSQCLAAGSRASSRAVTTTAPDLVRAVGNSNGSDPHHRLGRAKETTGCSRRCWGQRTRPSRCTLGGKNVQRRSFRAALLAILGVAALLHRFINDQMGPSCRRLYVGLAGP